MSTHARPGSAGSLSVEDSSEHDGNIAGVWSGVLYGGVPLVDGAVSLRAPDPAAIRGAAAAPDVTASVARWLAAGETRENVCYFAVHDGDELVGQIFLHDIDADASEGLVGYHLLRPGDRGRGVGTRALGLLQAFVRERTRLRRLIVITSADNAASRRVAEKRGFRHVGAPREDPTGVLLRWDVPRPDLLALAEGRRVVSTTSAGAGAPSRSSGAATSLTSRGRSCSSGR